MNNTNQPTAKDFAALLPSLEVKMGRKLPLLMQTAPYNNGTEFSIPSITSGYVDAETAFSVVSSLFRSISPMNK